MTGLFQNLTQEKIGEERRVDEMKREGNGTREERRREEERREERGEERRREEKRGEERRSEVKKEKWGVERKRSVEEQKAIRKMMERNIRKINKWIIMKFQIKRL